MKLNIGKSKTHGEVIGEWTDTFFSEEEPMNQESNHEHLLKDFGSDLSIKIYFIYILLYYII